MAERKVYFFKNLCYDVIVKKLFVPYTYYYTKRA